VPRNGNHHFIVVCSEMRGKCAGTAICIGRLTYITADPVSLEITEKRISFSKVAELPTIIHRCISLGSPAEPMVASKRRKRKYPEGP
jgi:hypothetical protein